MNDEKCEGGKRMEYSIVKNAIKEAINQIITCNVWNQQPIVIVDYAGLNVQKFHDEIQARKYLERYTNLGDWDELPWDGEIDEEIILIKYCGGYKKNKYPHKYKHYSFYKKVNGVEIYRKKELVVFSAHAYISVNV